MRRICNLQLVTYNRNLQLVTYICNLAQVLVALGLAGTSIAQIIACAGDMYYINNSFSKRCG